MNKNLGNIELIKSLAAGIVILAGIWSVQLINHVLFHSLAELFCIIIGFGVFLLAWNSRLIDNSYLLFLGLSMALVSSFGLLHALAFQDASLLSGDREDLAIQLWITTRYLLSLAMLISPFLLGKTLNRKWGAVGFLLAFILLMLGLFFWRVFPACLSEDGRITVFKIVSEIIIVLLFATALLVTWKKKSYFDSMVFTYIMLSIGASIAAELVFAQYPHVHGSPNAVGHLLIMSAAFLMYKAILEIGLRQPVALMFYNLKRSEEALRTSEERLRMALEAAGEGLFDWNRNPVKSYVSPRLASILEMDMDGEYLNWERWLHRAHEDDLDRVKDNILIGIYSDEGFFSEEFRVRLDNGEWGWMIGRGRVVERDKDGLPLRIVGISLDITERKKLEEKYLQALRPLQGIMNNSTSLIFIKDAFGRFLVVNKRFEALHGITNENAAGKSHFDVFPRETAEQFDRDDKKVISSGRPLAAYETLTIKGEERVFFTTKFPLFDSEGRVEGLGGIAVDVTSLKKAEETLKLSEQKYRSIFEQANDSIFITDLETRLILDLNENAAVRLGYGRDELMNMPLSEIIGAEQPLSPETVVNELAKNGHYIFESIHGGRTVTNSRWRSAAYWWILTAGKPFKALSVILRNASRWKPRYGQPRKRPRPRTGPKASSWPI